MSSRLISGPMFWTVALLARLVLLPMEPGLDIHRYIWEGRIQHHGFNPYRSAPAAEPLEPLRDRNWSQVQFKETTAIYPPLTELGFRLLASISQRAVFFKLGFVATDVAVCWLLARRFGHPRALLHAWNPLVLYSFAGGGHFDSWLVLPLAGAWLAWNQRRFFAGCVLLAAATAIKWIALPLLLWAILRTLLICGKRSAILNAVAASLVFVVPWVVVTRGDVHAPLYPHEFVLYARSLGVIPTILSWFAPDMLWQNKPYLLAMSAAALILICSRSITLLSERWVAVLLVLSPMVHAWYFTWLIPFAVATRNAGAIAVSISAFAYFGITALPGAPQTGWPLLFAQAGLLWAPFLCGFIWTEYRRRNRRRKSERSQEYVTDLCLSSDMKKITTALLIVGVAGFTAASALAEENDKSGGQEVTVTGEVLDMACYVDHGASGDKHADCAKKCISSGLPVGIKANDGKTYLVIGDHKPLNSELADYAAKTVTIKGKLASRGGVNMIENAVVQK